MNAAWPAVVDWHLSRLPLLPDWDKVTVYDGQPTDSTFPPSFVTVGFVDGEDVAGSAEPGEQLGDVETENGSVRSELVCQAGDVDLSGRRTAAFALINALKAELRADPTLGGVVQSASLSWDVLPVQNTKGSAVRVALSLNYTALGV